MSKGKKFTAAEKHFMKKEAKLKKEADEWFFKYKEYEEKFKKAEARVLLLEAEKESRDAWIERLLELTELSREQVAKLIKDEKRAGELTDIMENVLKLADSVSIWT